MVLEFRDRKGNRVTKPNQKEINNRISVYGLAKKGNKFLLVKPKWKNEFELPGGATEKNEDKYEALKREFLEETGFSIKVLDKNPIKTKQSFFYADDIDTYFDSRLFFFLVEVYSKGDFNLINKDEIRQLVWIDFDELKNKKINDLHFDVINQASQNCLT